MKTFETHPRGDGQIPIITSPDYVEAIALAATTAQSFNIPAGCSILVFSAPKAVDFYVNWTTTATIPGASTTTGVASELNPFARAIPVGKPSISLISPVVCVVTISCYAG